MSWWRRTIKRVAELDAEASRATIDQAKIVKEQETVVRLDAGRDRAAVARMAEEIRLLAEEIRRTVEDGEAE